MVKPRNVRGFRLANLGPALSTSVLQDFPIVERGFDCKKISGLAVIGELFDRCACPCKSATV